MSELILETEKTKPLIFQPESSNIHLQKELTDFSFWWQKNHGQFDNLSFRINNQVNLFLNSLNQADFSEAFSQLKIDIYGYYLEYIRQEGILPLGYSFDKKNHLVGDFYGQKPVVEAIDSYEREGALKKGVNDLEKKLFELKKGETIFRISPSGWTGLGYDYTESQAQIFWRDENKIRGLTIRLQTDLEAIIKFIDQLGIRRPDNLDSEKEIIKWVVEQNFTLPYSTNQVFRWLINNLSDRDHQGRSLQDQFDKWQEKDQTFFYYDQIANLIEFLESHLRSLLQEEDYQLLAKELKKTLAFILMSMTNVEIKREVKEGFSLDSIMPIDLSRSDLAILPPDFYQRILNHLKSLPGCAGGGMSSSYFGTSGLNESFVITAFGPVEISSKEKTDKMSCVTCPFCNQLVDAEIINRDGKKFIHCPSCGAEVEK